MASYTTNLNLKKPAGSENVSIGDINNNMDLIDQAYGEMDSSITDMVPSKLFSNESATFEITIPNNGRHLIIVAAANTSARGLVLLISSSASGVINVLEISKGTTITYTTDTNKITVTQNTTTTSVIADLKLGGSFVSVSAV